VTTLVALQGGGQLGHAAAARAVEGFLGVVEPGLERIGHVHGEEGA